jgi:hypothetical protein
MYGVEAATGLGGLAAQAPAGNVFLASALRIRPRGSALIGGPPQTGVLLPFSSIGDQTALPVVSGTGQAVEVPAGRMLSDWRQILDFHNSPAPWILIGVLILYGWLHAGYRRGRRS